MNEPHTYPCDACGGVGFTGHTGTRPCRRCGTSGELTDNGSRPPTPAPLPGTPWAFPAADPWTNPAAAGPPPF